MSSTNDNRSDNEAPKPPPSTVNKNNISSKLAPYFTTTNDGQYLVLVTPEENAISKNTDTIAAPNNYSGEHSSSVIKTQTDPTNTNFQNLQQRNKRRKTPKNESNNDNVKKRKKVNVREGLMQNRVTDIQTTSPASPMNLVKLDFENALKNHSSVGIPVIHEDVMKIMHTGSFHQNQLIQNGWLKYEISDFKSVSGKWISDYETTKNGEEIMERSLEISYQEVFKIQKGVFYIRYIHSLKHDKRTLNYFSKECNMRDINEGCEKLFDSPDDDPDTFLYNFFKLLESMPEDPKCEGQGFLMPYFKEFETIEMDEDGKRTGLRLAGLDSPLIEVCKHRVGGRKKIAGITTPMTTLGFPGSPITPTSLNQGPALGLLHQIKFGGDKTWLISPPRFMEKIQQELVNVLHEKLESSHPLMQQPLKCILNHGYILLGPEFYTQHKIPYKFVTQKAGEILMLASRTVYSGINMGMNGTKEITVVGPDFHVTYNEGQAINQCECEIQTRASQKNNVTINPGRKFTLKPEEIQVILQKSTELAKESRSNFAHLSVPPAGKPQKKLQREEMCEYCGAGFVYPTVRDKHEQRGKCTIYGKCKILNCKENTRIFTSRDMAKHIKNNHSEVADLIAYLDHEHKKEARARIAIRREKEKQEEKGKTSGNQKKILRTPKKESSKKIEKEIQVPNPNVLNEETFSNVGASNRTTKAASKSSNLLSYSNIRYLPESSFTFSQIMNYNLPSSKMLNGDQCQNNQLVRLDLPTDEYFNITFNSPMESAALLNNATNQFRSSDPLVNFPDSSDNEVSLPIAQEGNMDNSELDTDRDLLINQFLSSSELINIDDLDEDVIDGLSNIFSE